MKTAHLDYALCTTLCQYNSGVAAKNNQIGTAGQLLGNAASAYYLFSDMNLKKNIKPFGKENGHNIYEFEYKEIHKGRKFIGVIAQEVAEYMPEAVMSINGDLAVNYKMLGVEMREVA